MADNNAQTKKTPLNVYTIRERGDGKDPFWLKIGVAFTNRDGSLNVVLDALPVDGKLHIREKKAERNGE